MPGLEDRIDAVAGLGALELHSPREMNGLSAPMEEDSAAEVQRKERAAQMDRASALIGQRMLQGWAMLDLSCPQCYSPIMRDRQRQLWCVSCDMRVVDESERAATNTAGGDSKEETSGQAPTPKRKSSPEVVTEALMEHSQGDAEDVGRGAKRQARDAALSVQLPNQAAGEGSHLTAVALGLQSSLVGKLETLREAVLICQDGKELSQLLDLIQKCASTIKVVNQLSHLVS